MRAADPLFAREVEEALSGIALDEDPLEVVTRLRSRLPPALARRAALLHHLRGRARRRFGDGALAFLTEKGLEQATAPAVARARAARIRESMGRVRVWDATCGLGSDALALAGEGHRVVLSDRDPFTLACAHHNLVRAGLRAHAVRADAARPVVRADVLVIDPDRRPSGRRERDPERWSPPLSAVLALARRFPGASVALPPGLDPTALPRLDGAWELEWVSLDGELRELTLWLGALAGGARRAVLALRTGGEPRRLTGDPGVAVPPLEPDAARGARWLAEADPAVLRSGLLGTLAAREGVAPIAPRCAYLAGARRPESPLLSVWPVLGTSPLDKRRLRALLREHDVGPLTVMKRGHPDTAEVLAVRLRGPGREPGLLAVARLERGHLALLLGSKDSTGEAARDPDDGPGGR